MVAAFLDTPGCDSHEDVQMLAVVFVSDLRARDQVARA